LRDYGMVARVMRVRCAGNARVVPTPVPTSDVVRLGVSQADSISLTSFAKKSASKRTDETEIPIRFAVSVDE